MSEDLSWARIAAIALLFRSSASRAVLAELSTPSMTTASSGAALISPWPLMVMVRAGLDSSARIDALLAETRSKARLNMMRAGIIGFSVTLAYRQQGRSIAAKSRRGMLRLQPESRAMAIDQELLA